MKLIWRFNRGKLDALREIYEERTHALVTMSCMTYLSASSGPTDGSSPQVV
ncbi:MAG: hypothetical protein ABSE48_14690 [Verrucomicrobiota bacterium]